MLKGSLARLAIAIASSDPTNRHALDDALQIADAIVGPDTYISALAAIATIVAKHQPDRVPEINYLLYTKEKHSDEATAGISIVAAIADDDLARAVAVAQAIPAPKARDEVLANIAIAMATDDPTNSDTVETAIALAKSLPTSGGFEFQGLLIDPFGNRDRALTGIAAAIATADVSDPNVIEHAMAVVGQGADREEVLASVAGASGDIDFLVQLVVTHTRELRRCNKLMAAFITGMSAELGEERDHVRALVREFVAENTPILYR